jgi:hypothetical protein
MLLGNAEHPTEFSVIADGLGDRPQVLDLGVCELGGSMLFASNGHTTALRVHVPHVVRLCTEEQMRRIATGRIVATVKDVEPIRNRSVLEHPCNAVR